MTTFRFTIPSRYGKGTPGHTDALCRQGYYTIAESIDVALREVAFEQGLDPEELAIDPAYLKSTVQLTNRQEKWVLQHYQIAMRLLRWLRDKNLYTPEDYEALAFAFAAPDSVDKLFLQPFRENTHD